MPYGDTAILTLAIVSYSAPPEHADPHVMSKGKMPS